MKLILFFLLSFQFLTYSSSSSSEPEIVSFQSGALQLKGELFLPKGKGPFPAVLYNHGSAPGMLSSEAAKIIGPKFADKGWIFFMPYRRGQVLSSKSGVYISDEIANAEKNGGEKSASSMMVRLLSTDHLNDQMAALNWLKNQKYVQKNLIAVAGNSFGGIQAILGAEKVSYCAAINASPAAESWSKAPELQELLKYSVVNSNSPIFFFQAENDFDLSPIKILTETMKSAGKTTESKIYPSFGKTAKEGHSFAYLGSNIWFDDVFVFLNKHCKFEGKNNESK